MTRAKKIVMWACIVIFGAPVAFVGFSILAISWPPPPVVEGTDRPDWLPLAATDVFHRSQEGFGWWKAAEFTISESDFRAYAAEKGWALEEARDCQRPTWSQLLRPAGRNPGEEDHALIPHALVYQRLQRNNGGVMEAFDKTSSRAYYSESHR